MAEGMGVHFTTVTVHPSQLRISGYPQAHDMNIEICYFCQIQIDWQNIIVNGSGKECCQTSSIG